MINSYLIYRFQVINACRRFFSCANEGSYGLQLVMNYRLHKQFLARFRQIDDKDIVKWKIGLPT